MITVTPAAKEYLAKVGKPNVSLNVKGGGCSGFQYEWGTTDSKPTVENLYIDPMAEMFLSVLIRVRIPLLSSVAAAFSTSVQPKEPVAVSRGDS